MPVIANSKPSQTSEPVLGGGRWPPLPVAAVALFTACLSACAVWLSWRQGWILYLGDAEAHLDIARRVIDSRTPGLEQLGTAWLPLPHLLMLPLVARDDLWRSGLAGAIPSAVCFVLGVTLLFAAARRVFASSLAGGVAAALYALNPNALYLQSTPLTEPVFFAAFAGLLYFTVRFGQTQSLWSAVGAGVAALAGTLTRYEGWFLIPFVTLYFLIAGRRRWSAAFLFGAIASLGPLAWVAHDRWFYFNFFESFSGPNSAKAIQGGAPYPGNDDWYIALTYYGWAARACAGAPLFFLAAGGVLAALWKRAFWPVLLLALPGVFYVLAIRYEGNPIFLPNLWPHSYYNTRYGLAVLPLIALCAAALVALVRGNVTFPVATQGTGSLFERITEPRALAGGIVAFGVIAAASIPWLFAPRPESWITWKESQVNSVARRAWTHEASAFFKAHYRPGDGIFTSSGFAGVIREAGIPLRATLTGDNGPLWESAVLRPDLVLWEQWAMVQGGDRVQTAINRARRNGPNYDLQRQIMVKGAPVIEIYGRSDAPTNLYQPPHEDPVPESTRRKK